MSAESAYKLVFQISGENDLGAATGKLTLYHHNKVVHTSEVFSGGLRSPLQTRPIPTGNYRLRLDIRGTVNSTAQLVPLPGGYFKLHNFYGIEKIELKQAQEEWGRVRVALNEPRQHMPQEYRGNFLHGKDRKGDYTHGCICERTETILNRLWKLPPQKLDLKVVK